MEIKEKVLKDRKLEVSKLQKSLEETNKEMAIHGIVSEFALPRR